MKSAPRSTRPTRARADLTDREKKILRLLCDGLTNHQISVRMDLSQEVVKSALKRIFRKIDAKNRTQAAVLAAQRIRASAHHGAAAS